MMLGLKGLTLSVSKSQNSATPESSRWASSTYLGEKNIIYSFGLSRNYFCLLKVNGQDLDEQVSRLRLWVQQQAITCTDGRKLLEGFKNNQLLSCFGRQSKTENKILIKRIQ